MEHKFHGLNRSQLNQVLNIVCDLKDRLIEPTEEEKEAYVIAIQCVVQILNRMADNKPIRWD